MLAEGNSKRSHFAFIDAAVVAFGIAMRSILTPLLVWWSTVGLTRRSVTCFKTALIVAFVEHSMRIIAP